MNRDAERPFRSAIPRDAANDADTDFCRTDERTRQTDVPRDGYCFIECHRPAFTRALKLGPRPGTIS